MDYSTHNLINWPVAGRCGTGGFIGSFHNDIILRWLRYHFSYFKNFLIFSKLLFLQNRNTSVKMDHGNLSTKFFDRMAGSIECHRMHRITLNKVMVKEVKKSH